MPKISQLPPADEVTDDDLVEVSQATSAGWVSRRITLDRLLGGSVAVGAEPPADPVPNSLWWNSDRGELFIWYVDQDSGQWVPATPSAANMDGVRAPEMYGAVGDGVTDDTIPLQTCVSAGGVIRLSRHYRVTAQITATSSVRILGHGGKITHDTAAYSGVLVALSVTGFEVYGLEVDGKKSLKPNIASPQPTNGIVASLCTGVIIKDCYVHDCFEHGIRTGIPGDINDEEPGESLYTRIEGNLCLNNGRADQHRGAGIWNIGRVRNITIANNICIGNEAWGIFIDDAHEGSNVACYNATITGNVVTGPHVTVLSTHSNTGIGISGTTNLTMTGNVVTGGYMVGMAMAQSQTIGPTGYSTISGNRVKGFGFGLSLVNASYVNVTGNHIETVNTGTDHHTCNLHSLTTGGFAGELHHVNFANNMVVAPNTGVSLDGYSGSNGLSHDVTIAGNDIRHIGVAAISPMYGVQINCVGNNNTVRENEIHDFYVGVRAANTTNSWPALAFYNHIKGSVAQGMLLGNPPTDKFHIVVGNVIEGSGTFDFKTHASSNHAATIVSNNTFKSTTGGVFPAGTPVPIETPIPNAILTGNYPPSINTSYVKSSGTYTVTTLPAAATAGAGARAFVTDANAATFLTTVAAGGANRVPVVSDGTAWKIG